MKLHKAAKFFDRDPVKDGYTGNFLFKGQFASYEGNQMDGTVQRRRILSIAPEIVLPDRRVVEIYDEKWVVGTPLTDGWEGTPIRRTVICKLVTDEGWIMSPEAYVTESANTVAAKWNVEYLKNTVNTQSSSDYSPQFRTWLGLYEQIGQGWILYGNTTTGAARILIVRSLLVDPTGFIQIFADEATNAYGLNAENRGILAGGLDPITEETLPSVDVRLLLVDMYKMYNYRTVADEKLAAGDLAAYAESGVVKAGNTLTIQGFQFQVLRATEMPGTQVDILHLRKA